jgi:putative phosphoribosyl transferase
MRLRPDSFAQRDIAIGLDVTASTKRGEDDYPIIDDKTLILLIDDRIATGTTAVALARWLWRKYRPAQLIIAAPVASKQAIESLNKEVRKDIVDKIDTVTTPSNFISVNQFYKDFEQISDANKVIQILSKWHKRRRKGAVVR